MNNKPLVSVIMLAYNTEKYIAEAIESIIAQTYTNWELLIGNDGSTDNYLLAIKKHSVIDHRIDVFDFKENRGKTNVVNELFSKCKGYYHT